MHKVHRVKAVIHKGWHNKDPTFPIYMVSSQASLHCIDVCPDSFKIAIQKF